MKNGDSIEKVVTINRASYVPAEYRPKFRVYGTAGDKGCVLVTFEFEGGEAKVYAESSDLRAMGAACLEAADVIEGRYELEAA